jgi:hypothetical protein
VPVVAAWAGVPSIAIVSSVTPVLTAAAETREARPRVNLAVIGTPMEMAPQALEPIGLTLRQIRTLGASQVTAQPNEPESGLFHPIVFNKPDVSPLRNRKFTSRLVSQRHRNTSAYYGRFGRTL